LENLANYVKYLDKLIKDLEILNAPSSEFLIEEIQRIFVDFKNRSQVSKEKSTYLIGKEIRDIKDSIGKFFREIDEFIHEEKSFFEELNLLKEASGLSKKIKELETVKLDLEEEKTGLENELESLKETLEEVLNNIEKIKESNEYKEQIEKKEKVKDLKEKLNKNLLELKNSIDLKVLAKRYHHEDKKMTLIKEYEENFSRILSNENQVFINLLDDQKKEKVLDKVRELRVDLEQVKLLINNKNPAEKLEEEKTNTEARLIEATSELERKQKSLDKFNEEIENFKQSIKEILEKVDARYMRQTF
jgi:chromosome segregation ATPase